jgi:hypothetical protein
MESVSTSCIRYRHPVKNSRQDGYCSDKNPNETAGSNQLASIETSKAIRSNNHDE